MTPPTPDVIGRYQVLRALPPGGMGQVYVALDPAIDRQVAIKVLREGADNPEMRRRFAKEARSAGRLHHQHIVAIFDVGEHEGKPFIAMEYIQGETLEAIISRHDPLSLERKIELMDGLFAGLQYAHRSGIVHRDIKPANLILDEDGVLKILDFGIARQGGTETQQNAVVGSLNYIPPEQLLSQPVDGRADMFSAGAVFYELLSYRQAFPGELPGVLTLILQRQPPPLSQIVQGLPRDVIDLVERCLAKDPADRPADMATLRRELAEIRRRLTPEDPPVLPRRPQDPGGPPAPTPMPRRRDTNRQELLRIRAEQIDAHLVEANAALARGAFQEALDACHRALVLDPENDRVLAVEERAQAGLESLQLGAWLSEARGELERGSLTAAAVLVERALSVNASSPDAVALRQAIDDARRELAEAQARARAIEAALARGRQALGEGDLAAAAAAAADVLGRDAKHEAGLAFKQEVDRAMQARREAERAREQVADARRRFEAGDHRGAIGVLERAAAHPIVADALAHLRRELDEIERIRKETALKVEEATLRFGRRDLRGALALIGDVLEREPDREDARALKKQIDEALAEERRVANAIDEAKTLVGTGRFKAALDTLEVVAKVNAAAPGLQDLRAKAQAGIDAEVAAQKRKQFDTSLTAAERAASAKEWAVALEHVRKALTIDASDAKARELMGAITTAMNAAAMSGKTEVIGGKTVLLPTEPAVQPAPQPARPDPAKGKTVVVPPPDIGDTPIHRPQEREGKGRTIVLPREDKPPPAPLLLLPQPVPPAPAPFNRVYAMAGAAAFVVVAALAWVMWPSNTPPEPGPEAPNAAVTPAPVAPTPPAPSPVAGTAVAVSITVLPWARLESITRADGSLVSAGANLETPVVVSLPPGQYRARAVHPNYRPFEFEFTVGPGAPSTITQTMPDFRLDQEIESVIGGNR